MITALSMLSDEEQSKFQQIYSIYRKYIYLIAKKTLRDEHRTADCTQRSYEIILKNISKIGEVDSKKTRSYVYRITYSAALHIIRDERRYVPETEYEENNPIEKIEDRSGDIEHIIVNSEWKDIDVYKRQERYCRFYAMPLAVNGTVVFMRCCQL